MKIGIYGGTFNPPHLGHLAAARTALDALKLDKLILMPAAVPPHKVLPENSPAQEHRDRRRSFLTPRTGPDGDDLAARRII